MSTSARAAALFSIAAFALSGCAEIEFLSQASKEVRDDEDGGVPGYPALGGRYKIGNPYQINGVWYYPKEDYKYLETGIASWYGPNFHGKRTANGARFDQNDVTAAHRTLPMPSMVRVTNLENGRSLKVLVNDRGPFARGRIIDLSRRSAQLLGFEKQGTAKVRVEILAEESRQLASRFERGKVVAQKPDAAPSIAVTSQTLEPPPGAKSADPASSKFAVAAVDAEPVTIASRGSDPVPEPDGKVTILPVSGQSQVFIQAGAFSQYHNAARSQAILSQLGTVQITQFTKAQVPLFRVRVGPIANVNQADALLERVVATGYPDAHIIVVD